MSFARHAPAVFYSRPEVRNSPTTVVLRRVFSVPMGSRVRPWNNAAGYGCGYPRPMCSRRRYMRPPPSPYYPMPNCGYAPSPMMMGSPSGYSPYAMPPLQPCTMPNCACGGRKLVKSRSSRRRKARGTAPSTLVRQHRRRRGDSQSGRRRTGRSQRGGGSGNNGGALPCYQHQVCPNHQRYLYDAQGQTGCMQPLAQGQRFVFPTAVLPVMAPSYYPAGGPIAAAVPTA